MKIFVASLLVVLSGCATVGSKVAEDMASVPPGKGLVIFSTGADKTNLAFSTGLTLVQASSSKQYDKVIISIDYPWASNFPNKHGHVRSLALPEGDYFLIPNSGNPFFCLTKYPTYKFTVQQGGLSYIGSFQLASNRLTLVTSNLQRDISFFHGKNPQLKNIEVIAQEPVIGEELLDTCVRSSLIKGTIWDVP